MEISFTNDFIATERFENEYEEQLREEPEVREEVIRHGLVINMFLDDVLIGECFGITPYEYAAVIDEGQGYYREDDAITDVDMSDHESVYVWSTTILPAFRGMGYGKKLRKEFAKYASEMGYAKLLGHATSKSMVCLAESMGAIFRKSAVHKEWFGTDRTARFYTQFLTQTNEYNCGPFALAYLLEMNERTYSVEYLEKALKTTDEYGTSPGAIQSFLIKNNIPHGNIKELKPNSMIDINVEGDGHWIVLVQKMNEVWQTYDPDKGLRLVSHKELLRDWHSPRYGKYQGFTLL